MKTECLKPHLKIFKLGLLTIAQWLAIAAGLGLFAAGGYGLLLLVGQLIINTINWPDGIMQAVLIAGWILVAALVAYLVGLAQED